MDSVFNCNAYRSNYISNSWFYKFNQKIMKLISNTEYGIEIAEMVVDEKLSIEKAFLLRCKYDQFLKQPLKLEMFVPCDLDGNVLEEPDFMSGDYDDNGFGDVDKYKYKKYLNEYQEAKERVLFEGFEVKRTFVADGTFFYRVEINCLVLFKNHNNKGWYNSSEITFVESLTLLDLTLTESAKKQIGL